MEIGTQVIRKNYKGNIGTIERLFASRNGRAKAYVRWHDALNLFYSGVTDNHSSISMSALVCATDENLERQKKSKARRQLKWAKERWETCKDWVYCSQCHTRVVADDLACYRCGPIAEVDKWIDGKSAREIQTIIADGVFIAQKGERIK